MNAVVDAFANDTTFQSMLVLIALDLVLGVAAAVKLGDFAFSKLALFARDDLLGKVFPWFVVYAAWKYAPDVSVLGVDLEIVQYGVFSLCVVALVGSLTSSLQDLGLSIPNPLARGENQ